MKRLGQELVAAAAAAAAVSVPGTVVDTAVVSADIVFAAPAALGDLEVLSSLEPCP